MMDNSEIQLQENIPLSDIDLKYIETQQKAFAKTLPTVFAICTLFTMGFISLCVKDNFINFNYYDYILFVGAGFAMFGFCYFIGWSLNRYDNYNWKKDKTYGKNKLTSVIISRDKTEYGEYLTFAGRLKKDKIRLKVKQGDYDHYQIGTKVLVTYLKFSKEALELIEF